MNPTDTLPPKVRTAFLIAIALAAIGLACMIVLSLVAISGTGSLKVTSSTAGTTITISQDNYQAAYIGTGSANIRIKPGTYQIVGFSNGKKTSNVVQVNKSQTARVNLDFSKQTILPSALSINFLGMDTLINRGLTTAQVHDLKLELFKYKPAAKSVAIDPSTIARAARNPDVDTTFKINFDVAVDNVAYKATITYSDLDTVQLMLFSPTNNSLLYNSTATQ